MAYSAPELLLVGAAQNLVLQTSGSVVLKNDIDCVQDYPRDIDVFEYNTPHTW